MNGQENDKKPFRLAAVGDLHCREDQHGRFREFVRSLNSEADALLLCGDLTDHGSNLEARTLAEALSTLTIPCAAVLGNHDYESNEQKELIKILHDTGVQILDGDHIELSDEIGIAGIKGFGGGFGPGMLQAFGEPIIRAYVNEAVNEALKLESALGQLDTDKKIVIMHYAPIEETTVGERLEIRSYLGTSRLSAPIDLYGADMVFHGHAHHGSHEGKTAQGVPVYNVAKPLLRRVLERDYLLVEL